MKPFTPEELQKLTIAQMENITPEELQEFKIAQQKGNPPNFETQALDKIQNSSYLPTNSVWIDGEPIIGNVIFDDMLKNLGISGNEMYKNDPHEYEDRYYDFQSLYIKLEGKRLKLERIELDKQF